MEQENILFAACLSLFKQSPDQGFRTKFLLDPYLSHPNTNGKKAEGSATRKNPVRDFKSLQFMARFQVIYGKISKHLKS